MQLVLFTPPEKSGGFSLSGNFYTFRFSFLYGPFCPS
jgi:hypothetical protein